MAKTALRVKQARKPKFRVRAYTRCQRVRQAQGGLSQVRPLPDLPARNGAPGRATRHHEVVLVMMIGLRRSSALTPGQPPGLRRLRPGARPIHVRKAAPKNDEGLVTSRLACW